MVDQRSPGEGGWYSNLSPEPIDVIESWGLDFHRAVAVQYIVRAPMKNGVEDIDKAIWYLQRYRRQLEG